MDQIDLLSLKMSKIGWLKKLIKNGQNKSKYHLKAINILLKLTYFQSFKSFFKNGWSFYCRFNQFCHDNLDSDNELGSDFLIKIC